jgi:hypothetical protein
MIVFAVALVLTALVVTVVLVSVAFRDTAFCPRREALVDIVDGRCRQRATTCADAPIGCERDCITVGQFAARGA